MDSIQLSVFNVQSLRRSPDLADVTFRFKEAGSNGDVEIKAHRVVLALTSEIFKTQFFEAFPAEETVLVEDSTLDTFNTFLDIIYNVGVNLKKLNLRLIGDLFYLAEKYRIGSVKTALLVCVKAKEFKREEVLDVLRIAESYSHLEEFANSLVVCCADFAHASTVSELMSLFDEVDVEEKTSVLLHKFMSKSSQLKKKRCKNCQHLTCLHDSVLNKENFVKGAFIRVKFGAKRYKGRAISFEGEIVNFKITNDVSGFYDDKTLGLNCSETRFKCN